MERSKEEIEFLDNACQLYDSLENDFEADILTEKGHMLTIKVFRNNWMK